MNNSVGRTNYIKDAAIAIIIAFILSQFLLFSFQYIMTWVASLKGIDYKVFTGQMWVVAVSYLLNQGTFIAVFLYFFKKNKTTYNKNIFSKPDIFISLLLLIVGVISLYLLAPAVNLVQYGFTKAGLPLSELPFKIDNAATLIFAIFILGILPGVCEELLFRGVIFTSIRTYSPNLAIIFSSVLFSIFHLSAFQLIYPLLFGLFLGIVMDKYNNIWYCIFIHTANNILVLVNEFIANTSGGTSAQFALSWQIAVIAFIFMAIYFTVIIFIKKSEKLKSKFTQNIIVDKNQSLNPLWVAIVFMSILWIIIFLTNLLG